MTSSALMVQIEVPDFTKISDDDLETLLPHHDGAWSRQSRWLMQRLGASGLNLNAAWALRSTSWVCPCCRRPKPAIARLTPAGILLCQLDYHHDHLRDHAEKLFAAHRPPMEADQDFRRRWSAGVTACKNLIERFGPQTLCTDCNTAEGKAKLKLKEIVPDHFSFSPSEIRRFIAIEANRMHEVDIAAARGVWEEVRSAFEGRLALAKILIDRLVAGELLKEHGEFLDPRPPGAAEPLTRLLIASSGGRIDPYKIAGQIWDRSRRAGGVGSSISGKRRKKTTAPTDAEFEALDAELQQSPPWRNAGPDWRCEVCERDKRAILRQSNKGRWTAHIHGFEDFVPETDERQLYRRDEESALVISHARHLLICQDCREIVTVFRTRHGDLSAQVLTVHNLRAAILACGPNQRHEIDYDTVLQAAHNAGPLTEAVARFQRHWSLAVQVSGQYDHLVRYGRYGHEAAVEALSYEVPSWGSLDIQENIVWLLEEAKRLHYASRRIAAPDAAAA